MQETPAFQLRLATRDDVPTLHALIEASVRGLQAGDYTPAQIEGALGTVLGLDTQLIADQTYFVAEYGEDGRLAGCGGWSKRRTLFGADRGPGREPELLDPKIDAAKVRAIFVHPGRQLSMPRGGAAKRLRSREVIRRKAPEILTG